MKSKFLSVVYIFLSLFIFSGHVMATEVTSDWLTGFPRESVDLTSWPNKKKVAVCFVLYVEEWGFGHGPNFRPDMVNRNPDVVDEGFRQYAIHWGITRSARIFNEEKVPLSVALNALFLTSYPKIWQQFRTLVPKAPIVAHGMNNSTELLPLGRGLDAQKKYVRDTLDLIETKTGVRPKGWTSPSVYPNADTFTATAAEGLVYTLDSMDSDILSRLKTPSGSLLLIPYPAITVDMGQFLSRNKSPDEIGKLWIEYITELSNEAKKYPDRDPTVVAIGIHPFVVGTPNGAVAIRKVLEKLKDLDLVWLTDVETVSKFE